MAVRSLEVGRWLLWLGADGVWAGLRRGLGAELGRDVGRRSGGGQGAMQRRGAAGLDCCE